MKIMLYIAINLILPIITGLGTTFAGEIPDKSQAYSPINYSSFFGLAGNDEITNLVVSGSHLYILGSTDGSVPVTKKAFSGNNSGKTDIFVAKFRLSNGIPDTLLYSTMFGGIGNDTPVGMIVDDYGRIIVTGSTNSPDLPIADNTYDIENNGGTDVFIAILNPESYIEYSLSFSSFFGGTNDDTPSGVFLRNGLLYIAGTTNSVDIPVTKNAYNENPNGESEVFITILDINDISQPKIIYTSYFGGDKSENLNSFFINENGMFCFAGTTNSDDLHVSAGAFSNKFNNNTVDGYVAIINPLSGGVSDLIYSTYFGGNGDDFITCICPDSSMNIVIGGYTNSSDIATTTDALFKKPVNEYDLFLARMKPEGNSGGDLIYSTYFGGIANDVLSSFTIDSEGFVYLAGYTESIDFPTASGSYDRTYNGLKDAFLTKLNIYSNIDNLINYSTFLGANNNESAMSICRISDDSIILAGSTESRLFPVTSNAFDGVYNNKADGFLTILFINSLKIASISGNDLCWGDSLFIEYIAGEYADNNIFTFELSDSSGKFDSPYILGKVQNSTSGLFKCLIPNGLPNSDKYRIRLRSSSPFNQFYSDTNYITISPIPDVSYNNSFDICYNSPAVKLTGGSPEGGIYSGEGVNNGWFYPAEAGIGIKNIYYTVHNEFGCSNSAQSTITVHELPTTPGISFNNGRMESNIQNGNQWYLDGEIIAGATNNYLVPVKLGKYTVIATNEWGCSSFPSEPYIHNIKEAAPVFRFGADELSAEPGQVVKVRIFLDNEKYIKLLGIKYINAEISFNSSILEPWNNTPQGYVRDGKRIIEISCHIDSLRKGVLKELELRATLGNDTSTSISIDNMSSDIGNFEYISQPTIFHLLGICNAGGLRLTGSFGRTELAVPLPNPAGSTCRIEFEIVEKGWVNLQLINTNGELSKLILSEYFYPGRRQIDFNLEDIPSGTYFLVMNTPAKVRLQRLNVVK